MRLRLLAMVGVTVLVLMVGCGPDASQSTDPKTRWLAGVPCKPPCWEGITVNETTYEQAKQALEDNTLVDSTSITEKEGLGFLSLEWKLADSGWNGYLVSQDRNSPIPIGGVAFDTPDLCLGEIIRAYGEPELVFLPLYEVGGILYLVWRAKSIVYFNQVTEPGTPVTGISEHTCGGRIVLITPDTPLAEMPLASMSGYFSDDTFGRWTGYNGNYDYPNFP